MSNLTNPFKAISLVKILFDSKSDCFRLFSFGSANISPL